jgi:hypothetical protein
MQGSTAQHQRFFPISALLTGGLFGPKSCSASGTKISFNVLRLLLIPIATTEPRYAMQGSTAQHQRYLHYLPNSQEGFPVRKYALQAGQR